MQKCSRGIDAKTKDAIENVLDGQYCQPKKLHIKQAKLQNETVPSLKQLQTCMRDSRVRGGDNDNLDELNE
jgi:hypothetical protein